MQTKHFALTTDTIVGLQKEIRESSRLLPNRRQADIPPHRGRPRLKIFETRHTRARKPRDNFLFAACASYKQAAGPIANGIVTAG